MPAQRSRTIGVTVIVLVNALCILLLALWFFSHEDESVLLAGKRTITSSVDEPFFQPHPQLGYTCAPGEREIRISLKDQSLAPLVFTYHADRYGHRLTSPAPETYANKPGIWIFGCSLTWGWGLPDDQTYAALLQKALPAYHVRNFGQNGYGNGHALLQLRRQLEASPAPQAAIFSYATFHQLRNVADPERLRRMARFSDFEKVKNISFLKSELDESGNIVFTLVDFDVPEGTAIPTKATRIQVTKGIFREILDSCRQEGIVPILAVMEENQADPVPEWCARQGFHVVRMNIDFRKPENNFLPLDGHPNAGTNEGYASTLLDTLREVLPPASQRNSTILHPSPPATDG